MNIPTKVELEVAASGPAMAANRFFINAGTTVRITFCEEITKEIGPKFRTAVSLSRQDAIDLATLITQIIQIPSTQ